MKEGFESNTLSLEEFNEKYDADIVGLPIWLFALGVEDGKYHTYSKLESYAETLIQYWMEHISPSLPPKYYVIMCPMDGLGNNGDMTKSLTEINVTKEMIPSLKDSIGNVVGNINTNNYLVFHSKRKIYAMCKNINDPNTVLIPDGYYIREKAYEEKKKEIDLNRTPYPKRISECIWRGSIGNGTMSNFMVPKEKDMNLRQYFKKLYEEGRFPKVQFEDRETSIADQIKYKMILDIDGCSSTWSATVWKLYSGSVLLKQKSKWKQWFYDDMVPWIHYVPVENDFSDLNDKIEWCLHNEETCIEITENAHRFVLEKLNWERVKEETIATVLASME